jgi:hypothetical protein
MPPRKRIFFLIGVIVLFVISFLYFTSIPRTRATGTVTRWVGDAGAIIRSVNNGPPNTQVTYEITETNPGLIVYSFTQNGSYSNSLTLTFNLDSSGRGSASYYDKAVQAGQTIESICSPQLGCASDSPTNYTVLTPASGVAKIQYQSATSFVDITGTLYVLQGTVVTFKAIPSPTNSVFFFAGDGPHDPTWSGSSGATGVGETTTVTFGTASRTTKDYQTVTATVGNGGGSKTVNVIVYSIAGVLTPQVTFSGRSTMRYGIAEKVNLSFTATPAVTAVQAGGLVWKVSGGTGKLDSDSRTDGLNTYTAPNVAEMATLRLEVLAGPSKGLGLNFPREILIPNGASEQRVAHTNLIHTQNTCSVGFYGTVYLLPKDVSFSNIGFQEGSTLPSIATGYYASLSQEQHIENGPYNITDCNITTGCRTFTNPYDTVYTGEGPPPFAVGELLWPIPWMYVVVENGQTVATQFATGNHHQTSDQTGKATIEKTGAGPFSANASDRTTN